MRTDAASPLPLISAYIQSKDTKRAQRYVLEQGILLYLVLITHTQMHTLHYITLHYMLPLTQYSTKLLKLLPSKSDPWELLGSQFKVGTKLGEGNYGLVYKGTLSLDISTAPAQRHKDRMTRDGRCPYTVAIKLLKGAPTGL